MSETVVLLSIPGLRSQDLASMPRLSGLAGNGGAVLPLVPTFPCVTLPVQVSMLTGTSPQEHGVIANGYYWRDKREVEMWTAWNDVVERPQVWDKLHAADVSLTSLAWFPMWVKGSGADHVCVVAPRHNPDGSESMWCHTTPENFYEELIDDFGQFPLMNFWGPLSNVNSTKWIVDTTIAAYKRFRPRFNYVYLPHLEYAPQKSGPDSPESQQAVVELDQQIGRLVDGLSNAGLKNALWMAAGEYVITQVNGAVFPNRLLREAGLLSVRDDEAGGELLDLEKTPAWAMVDHQFAHVFVPNADDVPRVADLFRKAEGVAEVLVGDERSRLGMNHERCGEIVLISDPEKWFAYYWWLDDAKAPAFARTVDIHRKPGYDPVELFIDMSSKTTPLDASLVKGSHGYPGDHPDRQTVLLCSQTDALPAGASELEHRLLADIVLRSLGAV